MALIGIYGASGFGREVMPLVRQQFRSRDYEMRFIDEGAEQGAESLLFDAFAALPHSDKRVVIAIANSVVRQRLVLACSEAGFSFCDIKAPNAVILDDVKIGEGAILCSFAHLTSTIRIGSHFHANIYSYVAHDCIIGDFVTFAPGVKCNGNVHIEDHAYIGTGAILKQGTPEKPLRIGRGAVVGMGAVVTKDVPAGTTVVGNPARPLVR